MTWCRQRCPASCRGRCAASGNGSTSWVGTTSTIASPFSSETRDVPSLSSSAWRWVSDCAPWGCTGATGPRRSSSWRSEEHTSELQSLAYLVCRLLLEKKKKKEADVELGERHGVRVVRGAVGLQGVGV